MRYQNKKFLINAVTIFPEAFNSLLNISIIGSARKKGIWELITTNIKKFSENNDIDDKPYGGGPGMILKADALQNAFTNAVSNLENHTNNYTFQLLN